MKHQLPDETRTLIDELLAEQQKLTAVERFSRRHESDAIPAQAKYYRDLIPLTKPQLGQQYAFEVDLDKCTGCKACVSACHSLNGLDEGEAWRDVGLLFNDDWRQPYQQTVTTACHHCVDPGCLNGCPVLAYDKDPVTGIVRHLDDQCIGCQYCVMKCPYNVPKYSAKRGIVRKCDMCSNRLTVGEAPACAQACPSEAIRIVIVDQNDAVAAAKRGDFLATAPDPAHTTPTTRYKSSKPMPASLLAGDNARVTPAHAHLPLVFMLVLTQLSVGASVAAAVAPQGKWLAIVAFAIGAFALGIASLHLGKPLKAWRAFLGWRKSWFSREVIVFSAYMALASICALALWSESIMRGDLIGLLKMVTAAVGLMGVGCSAMIYADTHHEYWSKSQCIGKFLATTLLLGAAVAMVVSGNNLLAVLLMVATMIKFGFERRIQDHLVDEQTPGLTALNKSARLLAGELGRLVRLRVLFGVIGGILLPGVFLIHHNGALVPLAIFVTCLCGELLERYLFFTAVAPAKMPGSAAA